MAPGPRVVDPAGAGYRERSPSDPTYDLRHAHATLLIDEGGVNVRVVQDRLSHHSHAFTADSYQHVIPGIDQAAASRFDQLVFGDEEADEEPAEAPPADAH